MKAGSWSGNHSERAENNANLTLEKLARHREELLARPPPIAPEDLESLADFAGRHIGAPCCAGEGPGLKIRVLALSYPAGAPVWLLPGDLDEIAEVALAKSLGAWLEIRGLRDGPAGW